MIIGIDARFYGSAGKGLGRYTEKLIINLEKIDKDNQYFIFIRQENQNNYQPVNKNFTKVIAPYKWYSWEEQILLPRLLRKYQIDLMHFPHFNVPLLYRQPFVVTIHDLIITHFPTTRATTLGPIKYAVKRFGYQTAISSAVKRSKKVITVSNYTKHELVKYFNLPDEKIAVTYEAADRFPESDTDDAQIVKKYGISKPYLLYVGNAYPHKNLELLLKSFKLILQSKKDIRLVLVGRDDYFFKRLKDYSCQLGFSKEVIFTGYVPDQELPSLYRQALIYVFPSLAEGFGLPPLEAMQYQTAVAASSYTCLPEILGDGAAYFNPKNKHAIVDVLLDLIQDSNKRQILKNKGLVQVAKYQWTDMASQTLRLYQKVTNGK